MRLSSLCNSIGLLGKAGTADDRATGGQSGGLDFADSTRDQRDATCERNIRSFKNEMDEATRLVKSGNLHCDRKAGILNSMRVAARNIEGAQCPIEMNVITNAIGTLENSSCIGGLFQVRR